MGEHNALRGLLALDELRLRFSFGVSIKGERYIIVGPNRPDKRLRIER